MSDTPRTDAQVCKVWRADPHPSEGCCMTEPLTRERVEEVLVEYDPIVNRLDAHSDGPETDFVMRRDDYRILRDAALRSTHPQPAAQVRQDALEEAAKVCEERANWWGSDQGAGATGCAKAIRALAAVDALKGKS